MTNTYTHTGNKDQVLTYQPQPVHSIEVRFQKLHPAATTPTYATEGDAGMDLYSLESKEMKQGDIAVFGTGIAMAVPPGFVGLVHPRSGLAFKKGLTVLNTPGTIDSGYRGEIKVILIAHGKDVVKIEKGDRIAQLVIQPYFHANLREVSILDTTARNNGGFGSTGK